LFVGVSIAPLLTRNTNKGEDMIVEGYSIAIENPEGVTS